LNQNIIILYKNIFSMNFEIFVPLTLSQAQTFLALVLSILGVGWFFLLSAGIRYNASRRMMRRNSVPVLDTILPFSVIDIYNLLRIKRTGITVITCMLVILGLLLTNFDSVIVVNSIGYTESCKTSVIKSRAYITVDTFQVADAAYAETDAMLQKRNKSGIPSGVLVGQLPEDPRWRFDPNFDVDPYPWRSSCSIHVTGETIVNLNTSVMLDGVYQTSDLSELLPEVDAEFKFRDIPNGYEFTRRNYKSYTHFNRSNPDDIERTATGTLILIIEEFTRGNISDIGAGVIHRLWTLRVPEENRMPYHREDPSKSEIVTVPIVVKAYTCEVIRVKGGSQGSVNLLGDISVAIRIAGDLIGRKYLTAQIKGTDETILEYSPEYWASYMEVRDTLTAEISEVLVRINLSCISIHPIYILLVCTYAILTLMGILFWMKLHKNIPSSVVGWAVHACKESNLSGIPEAEFRYHLNDIRIFRKADNNPIRWELTHRDLNSAQLDYSNSKRWDSKPIKTPSEIYYLGDEKSTMQHYYSQFAFGSTSYPNT
jgi:hypothetical protein